jgi:hypothetical protein
MLGQYLRKAILAAIAEEIGHNMEKAPMKGCEDLGAWVEKVDKTALVCANNQIWITSRSGQKLNKEFQSQPLPCSKAKMRRIRMRMKMRIIRITSRYLIVTSSSQIIPK